MMNELSVRAPVIVVVAVVVVVFVFAKMLATKGGQRCRHNKNDFFCKKVLKESDNWASTRARRDKDTLFGSFKENCLLIIGGRL